MDTREIGMVVRGMAGGAAACMGVMALLLAREAKRRKEGGFLCLAAVCSVGGAFLMVLVVNS